MTFPIYGRIKFMFQTTNQSSLPRFQPLSPNRAFLVFKNNGRLSASLGHRVIIEFSGDQTFLGSPVGLFEHPRSVKPKPFNHTCFPSDHRWRHTLANEISIKSVSLFCLIRRSSNVDTGYSQFLHDPVVS